jgi:hypothetical protein
MNDRFQTEEEIKEAIEHRDVLLAIRAVLATVSGRVLFKYLFKHFGVTELPQIGLDERILSENLGFLRAGNSIFKLVAEANAEVAGELLATIEKDRYAQAYADAKIGTS